MAERPGRSLQSIIAEMRAQGNPDSIESMRQFGINVEKGFGLRVPQIRAIARGVIKASGRDQTLAEHLWRSGIHDARILATFIADPLKISRTTMDRWAADCNSWDICDACSYGLFDATPHAIPKIHKWAKDEREFVRRAAFATIAGMAVHQKKVPNEVFLTFLPLVEKYADDERNFVRKAVNWALRGIGKRNDALCAAAIDCAERVRAQGTTHARWIAADALRELRPRQNKNI
jgi:3-methyladenine DNA glycosylase AlkD